MKIIKRSGEEQEFDLSKIICAVSKANLTVKESLRLSDEQLVDIAENIERRCKKVRRALSVEEIQDLVEHQIMQMGAFDVAKNYITYRYQRALNRQNNTTDKQILSLIDCNNEEVKQENSNKNPTLGFKTPKYLHIAQIMRLDENGNKKKLSKRDMGANMDDYTGMGYCPEAVCEYVMTLLNSNYEEWRMQNTDKPYTDFPFNIKKMSVSGCLFDFDKLSDVSKNVISRMSAEKVAEDVTAWALEFDQPFGQLLAARPEMTKEIFAIGRGGKKPRKDLATWRDSKPYMGFFFDEYFELECDYDEKYSREDILGVFDQFLATFDMADDMNAWFDKIKAIAEANGYTSDMKAYRADPTAFKGNVADVSMFLRLAVTGKLNAPDMYSVMQILGKEKVTERIENMRRRITE